MASFDGLEKLADRWAENYEARKDNSNYTQGWTGASHVHVNELRAELAKLAAESGAVALTFDAFRAANFARCIKWHPTGIHSWSASDWLVAITGELGELASLLKMRNRERDGLLGNKFSPTDKQVADELADVLTYLDLLACVLGVDLGRAAVEKFNEVSERVGFPDRIVIGKEPAIPADWKPTTVTDAMVNRAADYVKAHSFNDGVTLNMTFNYWDMLTAAMGNER